MSTISRLLGYLYYGKRLAHGKQRHTIRGECRGLRSPLPKCYCFQVVEKFIKQDAFSVPETAILRPDKMKTRNEKKNLTREQILDVLRKNRALMEKYAVRRIGLFGSYATETQTARSDIDLLVEFDKPTYDNFVGLTDELEQLLGKKVEILTPDGLESIRVPRVAESIRKVLA